MGVEFDSLVSRADSGDVEAMVMVGDCYNRGLYTGKDNTKAQFYYRMAADKGHPGATFMVGLGYLNGNGVEKNISNAVKFIQKAADDGVVNAQHMAGLLFRSGMAGKLFKKQKAKKYFQKAAEQGHAGAQYELGREYLLEWSDGNDSKLEDSLFWLLCAALHSSEQSLKTSQKAKEVLSDIINKGYPLEVLNQREAQIREHYPSYILDPR